MTIQLPEDLADCVRSELTSGHFASEDALVAEAVRAFLDRRQQPAEPPTDVQPMHSALKPFWERAIELTADIPAEEWDKVPTDLAEQHDESIDQRRQPTTSPTDHESGDPRSLTIFERLLALTADIPAEEWDKVPTDLAEQHDHYIYGTPKRPTT